MSQPLPMHEVNRILSDLRSSLAEFAELYPDARKWRYGKDVSGLTSLPTGPSEVSDPTGTTAVEKEWASQRLVTACDDLEESLDHLERAVKSVKGVIGAPTETGRRHRKRRGPRRCRRCGNVLPKPTGRGRPPEQCPACREGGET